ncbi:alpha-glucan family phosphorylase, partial [bacterium]|nr:alpha-glucan family phosphorylase [bacterium]
GGVQILEKSGYNELETFHMNEGHSSFLTLALREKFTAEEVKKRCVFTTHTPVPAGHDIFKTSLVKRVLGENSLDKLDKSFPKSKLNMTHLALFYSRYTNGVSALNGEVARKMFPKNEISHITNGVHHLTWLGTETGKLFDKHLAGWRENPEKLREANSIPASELWQTHQKNKTELLDYVNAQTQAGIEENCLLIGFARRAATYKRAALLFKDAERLAKIGSKKLAIVYAGKAHPKDSDGKELIEKVVSEAKKIFENVTVVYLENYNIWLGRLITAGVDVWLNTPQRPNEASGTSGMKAALNGIPNLSILDGWWAEACKNEVNGWAIGDDRNSDDETDANLLYDLLEEKVLPTYYENREKWLSLMKEAIVTAADFTAQRMVSDYCRLSYKI